ncbi:MAG TPA: hypothetical protein VGJ84_02685, partial [Polyangiaceae bacterium]
MRGRFWVLSEDLSPTVSGVVLAICAVSMVFLALELRRRERFGISIAITGFVACALLACALLRPARVTTRGTLVGPRVAVLVDQSRRLLLPAEGGTRRQRALVALQALKKHFGDVRLDILGFGEGQPTPLDTDVRGLQTRLRTNSDLVSALSGLSSSAGERPEAVVVVSDGRLSAPADGVTGEALNRAVGVLSVPL